MMKKLIAGVSASLIMASAAYANEDVTLQLKWVTQAQFAGYYVAQDKGFYSDAGLNVTIKAGGPDIGPEQVIAGGGADVIVDWMPAALAAREKGLPLVNIAQPYKKSGMMLTCLKESGIKTPADFHGHALGVWFFGNEYPFLSWMSHLGIPTDGGDKGVTVLKQGFNVDPLLQKQAACISTMTYNEYLQVLDAGIAPDQLVTFKYEDEGVATLEDGLYVMEDKLKDPAFVETMAKFVKASMEGWKYAEEHPEEAAKIVLDNDETGAQTIEHQEGMMIEVAKLTEGTDGVVDPADYERTF
jgi:NitT/TauT family transport system substrate-binding protein